MDIKIQAALISTAVSLIAALVTLAVSRRQLAAQKEKSEKEISSHFLQSSYDMRLKHYPQAFVITSKAGKIYDLPKDKVIETHNEIADQLKGWRNSEVFLVISDFALEKSYDLEKELRKLPSQPNRYFSDEQKTRMWKKRQNFRHSLRKDLGLYLNIK